MWKKIRKLAISVLTFSVFASGSEEKVYEIKKHYERPDEKDFEFVGAYIDLIHELNWPDDSDSAEYLKFFEDLEPEVRVIWATWMVQAHVENGGFGSYYLSVKHGFWIDEAERGFKELGADTLSFVFDEVIQYYEANLGKIENCKNIDEYNQFMGNFVLEKKLKNVHDRFFKSIPLFYKMRSEYIKKHISKFENLKETGT